MHLLVDYSYVLSYVSQMFSTEWATWFISQMNSIPMSVEIIIAFEFLATFWTRKVLHTSVD